MAEFFSLLYFIGLIMFGVAVGVHTHTAPYAGMIIGGGVIAYAVAMGIVIYLHPGGK